MAGRGDRRTKEKKEKKKGKKDEKRERGKKEKYSSWMAVCLHPYPHLTSTIPNEKTVQEETETIAHTSRLGRARRGWGARAGGATVGGAYFGILIN